MVLPQLPRLKVLLLLEPVLVLVLVLEEFPEKEHRPLALEQALELAPVLAQAQEQEQATHQRRPRPPETQQPVEAVSLLAVVLLAELPLPAVRQL